MMNIPQPQLEFFAELSVIVGKPQEVGQTLRGRRRLIPIIGGQARGHGWSARVLPGGADFQIGLSASVVELDARYVLETDGGDLIFVHNRALRVASPELTAKLADGVPVDPGLIYFRCAPRFETDAPALDWISERLFIGSGVRHPGSVEMRFFSIL
jgi:hypothetical protein